MEKDYFSMLCWNFKIIDALLMKKGFLLITIICCSWLPMQSDADYWLLSDAGVSITDIWRTERILSISCLRCYSLSFWAIILLSNKYRNFFDSQLIAGVEWNDLGTLHEDYTMPTVSTPRPQTPPPSTTEAPPAANNTGRWNEICW